MFIMWLPCDHDLGITLLSSHAKETKYSNDVLPQSPSRTSRVYMDVLEDCDSGLISFFLERGTGKLRVQCDHSGLGARVFKLVLPPLFHCKKLRRFSKSGRTVDGTGQRKSRTATIISLNIEILLSNGKRRG